MPWPRPDRPLPEMMLRSAGFAVPMVMLSPSVVMPSVLLPPLRWTAVPAALVPTLLPMTVLLLPIIEIPLVLSKATMPGPIVFPVRLVNTWTPAEQSVT
jgi:hypothetical protein